MGAGRNRRVMPGTVRVTVALGIDVGGTKIAAGIVDRGQRSVLERRRGADAPRARRSGCAGGLCRARRRTRRRTAARRDRAVRAGRPRREAASADTVDWRGLDLAAAIEAPRVVLESDVRAAALAESRFGAGAGGSPFLFAIVGTGASACLVVDGRPYAGGRGEADRARCATGRGGGERHGARPRGRSGARRGRACGSVARAARGRRRDCAGRGARRARERARPVARRARGRAGRAAGLPASGSSGRVRRCSRTRAFPRFPSSAPRSPDGGMVGAALRGTRQAAIRLRAVLDGTGLWRDVRSSRRPSRRRSRPRDGFAERVAALLGGDSVRVCRQRERSLVLRRVALWLASLEGASALPRSWLCPAASSPAARSPGAPGDLLLAVSSSGEFRDLVEAIDADSPRIRSGHLDSGLDDRIAGRCRALVTVLDQRAVTHTQAFCGDVAALLAVWAEATSDDALATVVSRLPQVWAPGSRQLGAGSTSWRPRALESRSSSGAGQAGRRPSRRRCS